MEATAAPTVAKVEIVETVHCRSCWSWFDAGKTSTCPRCGEALVAPNGMTAAELVGRNQRNTAPHATESAIIAPRTGEVLRWSSVFRWGLAINAAAITAWLLYLAVSMDTVSLTVNTPLGQFVESFGSGPWLVLGILVTCGITGVLMWAADSAIMQVTGVVAGTAIATIALSNHSVSGIAFVFLGAAVATLTGFFALLFPDRD